MKKSMKQAKKDSKQAKKDSKQAKKDSFAEIKIKMVMKLRRISRSAAVAAIARLDAAHRASAEKARKDELAESGRAPHEDDFLAGVDELMTAEEFFSED